MKIDPKIHTGPIQRPPSTPADLRRITDKRDSLDTSRADGLRQELELTPEIRPEAVENARNKIGDMNYPSPDVTAKIAERIAGHLAEED